MEKLNLNEHFRELKTRTICCLGALIVSFCITYFYANEIYQFLLEPFVNSLSSTENRRMIYTSPGEGLSTFVKLSFYTSLYICMPFFLTQIYIFLSPGLYKNERKSILILFFFIPFLFLLGGVFSYYILLPLTLQFLVGFEYEPIQNSSQISIQIEAKISEYFAFLKTIFFSFGFAFQLPIFLIFLIKNGFISIRGLQTKRRYWIVAIFIIAAILTPPDVVSQISLAIPMLLLFEIAILIGKKIKIKT
jgi:sec-independent protein translocase protein TatC